MKIYLPIIVVNICISISLENLSGISVKTSLTKIIPSNSIGLTDESKNNSIHATKNADNPSINAEMSSTSKCNKQNGEHTQRDRSCQINSKELVSVESYPKQNSDQINLEEITPKYLILRNTSQQSQNHSNQVNIRNQKESSTNISESENTKRICTCNKNILNDDRLKGGSSSKSYENQSAVQDFPTISIKFRQRNGDSEHEVSRTNEEIVETIYFLCARGKCINRNKCHCDDCRKKDKKYLWKSKIPRLISNKTVSRKTEQIYKTNNKRSRL